MQHTEGVEQAAATLRLFQEKEGTVGKMAELQRELVSAWEKGKKAQEAAAAAARDLKRQLAQYGALLKKLGKCPICYGDITAATIRGILSEYTGRKDNGLRGTAEPARARLAAGPAPAADAETKRNFYLEQREKIIQRIRELGVEPEELEQEIKRLQGEMENWVAGGGSPYPWELLEKENRKGQG